MQIKKINTKSKGFATLVACLCLSAGAITMVAVTQAKKSPLPIPNTTVADVRGEAKGVKGTTKNKQAEPSTTKATSSAPMQPSGVSTPSGGAIPGENSQPYKGYFQFPLSEVVDKDFSAGNLVYSITMGDYRSHNGTDFNGLAGDNVHAICDGTVLSVTKDELWGTVVEVDHANAMVGRYAGFKTTALKSGDQIKRGDTMGTLGGIPIESSDGSHLHLELHINNKLVNPMEAMNKLGDQDVTAP